MSTVCFGPCDNDAEVVVQGEHVCRECAALLKWIESVRTSIGIRTVRTGQEDV